MITIVDYGTGNLRSIQNMLRYLEVDSEITNEPTVIARAGKLILPGVGKFDFGMSQLNSRGLSEALNRRVMEDGVPILGICLGAQLVTRSSEEGQLPGLGWIAARAVHFDSSKFQSTNVRVPHMGWTETTFAHGSVLSAGFNEPRFYYAHSYHLVADNEVDVLCWAEHGYRFTAGIEHANVLGVQFHPEKSHHFGMKLLQNFVA